MSTAVKEKESSWVVPPVVMEVEDDERIYWIRVDRIQAIKLAKEPDEMWVYLSGGEVIEVDAKTGLAIRKAWLKWVDYQVMNKKM